MKNSNFLFIVLILFLILNVNLILSCPEYPTPIDIDQNDPLLVDAYKQVDQIIQNGMNETRIISFIATIVYQDKIVWSKTYGNINPLDPKSPPLTLDNNIKIASITKVFTAMMMYQLRDKGVISLDDPISKYYPEFSIRNLYKTKREITLRQLASHQSGLPREVPFYSNSTSEESILESLSKMFVILPQYKQTHYSNLGYALLGQTLAKAAQKPFKNYITEKILEPLGMLNSSFSLKEVKNNMALGVNILPNGSYSLAQIKELGWNSPSGGLFSTARDMCKLLSFWLNENSDILDSSTINEALSPIALVNDGQTAYGTPFEMYYDSVNNIWMKSKSGAIGGYRSQMALVRPLKLGLFFSSQTLITNPDIFTRSVLQTIIPVYEKLILLKKNCTSSTPTAKKKDKKLEIPDHEFVGQYSNNHGLVLTIDNSGGSLLANFGDSLNYNLVHFSDKHPYIKRLELINSDLYLCTLANNRNHELIYFNLNNSYSSEQSVYAMGQKLYLISKDPNHSFHKKKKD